MGQPVKRMTLSSKIAITHLNVCTDCLKQKNIWCEHKISHDIKKLSLGQYFLIEIQSQLRILSQNDFKEYNELGPFIVQSPHSYRTSSLFIFKLIDISP